MKRILLYFISCLLTLGILNGCSNNAIPKQEVSSTLTSGVNQNTSVKVELDQLKSDGKYKLSGHQMTSNNNLILLYLALGSKNKSTIKIKVYDVYAEQIVSESQEVEQIGSRVPRIDIVSSGFYFTAENVCYVFNNIGKLVNQITISEEIARNSFWISNNLDKTAYVKLVEKEEAWMLFISDIDGRNEKKIYKFGTNPNDLSGINELYFSRDDQRLGYKGDGFPAGGAEQSISSYGYIDLKDNSMHQTVKKNINVSCIGDKMIIYDELPNPNVLATGNVYIVDLASGKETKFSMDNKRESECVYLCSNPSYMFGMSESAGNPTQASFTLYRNEKKVVAFSCDFVSAAKRDTIFSGRVNIDMDRKKIYMGSYANDDGDYEIIAIDFADKYTG